MSVPTLTSLVEHFRAAIYADASIASFCTTNYAKSVKLYVGYDQKNPPASANCPFIAIVPVGRSMGIMENEYVYHIDIDFGIVDNTFSDYQSNGSQEMRGFYRIDSFAELINTALETIASGHNLATDLINYQVTMDAFPLIVGQMTIEARLANTIGIDITL